MRNSLTNLAATLMIMATSMAAAQEQKMDMMHGCAKGMNMMDADRDGEISKQESMRAHEEMFADMDENDDGKISQNEMESMGHHGMMEKR